jgi:uncharacterized protein (UPF0333 family)
MVGCQQGKKRQAQAGLEYLVVLILMIAALVPIFYFASQNTQTARVGSEAYLAVNSIITAVDSVYGQSPGTRTSVRVYVPDGYSTNGSYFNHSVVSLRFYISGGQYTDVYGSTKGNVTGTPPAGPGYRVLYITMTNNNTVLIQNSTG